ncbi:MAG: DeoR/GlpR transcriptional regulator [Alphaproteobacteria bacterium]|nr:DeoR/GlpR transcriptional regulator [Alphaproteobacteria bacterium]
MSPQASRPRPRLSQEERHAQILALVRRDGIVRVVTLATRFGVTTETARRDLDELAANGAIKRTYGGGAGRSLIDEPGIGVRTRAHAAERGRIAAAAAAMIEPGDALMIDCGSTTSLFANALAARDLHLTVLTNCLPVATALATSRHCRIILCAGDYVAREGGVYGSDTIDFIRRFKANRAVIGAGGLTAEAVTDADSQSCAVKRAMIEQADRTTLLLDGSKFDLIQFERVCPLNELDEIVCDAPPPKRLVAGLKQAGVSVIVAP